MTDPLIAAVLAAHAGLAERLTSATHAAHEHAKRHEIVQKADSFLMGTCRHMTAMCDVVLPAARSTLDHGSTHASAYLMQVKRVERAAAQAKRRLYGEAHCADLPWTHVWSHLEQEVHALVEVEQSMVVQLTSKLSSTARETLVERLMASELISPTRPHPWSPQVGPFAHTGRRLLAHTDRFWDAAEGRIVAS